MSGRGWTLLAAVLAAGVAGDLLLGRAGGVGLNLALWAGLVAAAALLLARREGATLHRQAVGLLAAAAALAAGFAWRADAVLWTLDAFLLLLTVPLAVHAAHRGGLAEAYPTEWAYGVVAGATEMMAGPWLLVGRDVPWQELPQGRHAAVAAAVLRGALLAAPLLLVFGALFALADPAFARLLSDVLDVDAEGLSQRFAWLVLCGGGAAAVWRPLLRGPAMAPPRVSLGAVRLPWPLGPTEVATALALLDLLFLAFVSVQLRFLFGDAAWIERTAGLTYAAYARHGFFQLVAAVALVVPTLVAAHALLPSDRGAQRTFRLLAGALLVLVSVVLASAVHRLRLYYGAYGLTEARLYAAAFLVWVAAVLAWLAATVLRGRRDRFAWGALLAAYAVAGLLHLINPDAVVARANLAHYRRTGRFDAWHAAGLGPGAVPVLAPALAQLPPEARTLLADRFLHAWSQPPADWRVWNWDHARAAQAVAAHREELERLRGGP